MRAAFIHSAEMERYSYPPDCPFRTERAGRLRQALVSVGLLGGADRVEVPPRPASREELLAFHTERYLRALEAAEGGDLDVEALHMGLGTLETPIFKGLFAYASLAAGASLVAADRILAGEADVAFNPSGGYHHAHAERAGGFCYVNDVVLACERLARAGRRVAFVDIDAHHCDGVQEAFYRRRDVFTISFHESGRTLFPGTGWERELGEGEGLGYCANVPLPAGTDDATFLHAFRAVAVPLLTAYRPDVIVLELGMDMLGGDPLAHLNLTNNAHAEAAEHLRRLERPILAVGGGGYHVQNTVRGWALAWSVLCGEQEASDALGLGLGGVMLETTDWQGGLRDRMLPVDPARAAHCRAQVDGTIETLKATLFPMHGIRP
jgi:acetoin utilization protein AcuC